MIRLRARSVFVLATSALAFVLALSPQLVGAQAFDPCPGCIKDKLAHPMPATLAKPAKGACYTDPTFGTRICRITAAPTGNSYVPAYNTNPVFNADESYLLLYHQNPAGGSQLGLYNGRTYAFIKTLPFFPSDLEDAWWDTTDPDVIWYPDGVSQQLRRYQVSTNTSTLVHQFSCGANLLEGNGHGFTSWDSKVFGLRCNNNGDHIVYNRATNTVTGQANFGGTNSAPRRAPLVAASGLRVLEDFSLTMYMPSLQPAEALGLTIVEHASLGKNAAGRDVYNAVSYDDAPYGSLVSTDVLTGAHKVIIGPNTGYPYPKTTTHPSSHAYKRPGWVAVSSVGTPQGLNVLEQEILLGNVDTGVVYRVAHHRSCAQECGNRAVNYWAEPHVNISPSATRLVFGSDWNGGNTVDAYVVELPSYGSGSTGTDLSVTQTDSPDPVLLGNDVTYTVTVRNNGSAGATGVRLTEALPAGLNFVSSNPGSPTCTASGGTVTCNLGSLSAGASATVAIVASPASAGSYTAQATVSANETDSNAANNSASQTTTAQPGLSIGDRSVAEGNSGTVNAVFTATLSAASNQTVTVNWATANGTATSGSDYVAGSGSLSFPAGTTSKTISVVVNGDATSEPDETFFVNLTGAVGAIVSDSQGKGTITNDDSGATPRSLSINDVSLSERNSGAVTAVFNVTLSASSTQTVTVNYATANGTATAGSDYVARSGSLSFAPGATTQTISVTVNGDTVVEPNETFFVNLSGPVGATLADGQGVGTITNDDSATNSKAAMLSPTPGSTLSGSTVTFTWSAGTGVTAYWLEVGTTLGGKNIYGGAQTTARSATVTGLPTNGGPVYARLWSLMSAGWAFTDYTYTSAAGGATLGKAVMQTPVPSTTLAGSTVTFTWSAGTGATAYWLEVGTTLGGNNIYRGAQTTARSATVTGLPTNGSTVFVRLWTLLGGVWQYNAYTYTASGSGGSKAVMQSPTPGSTLTSSTVTFSWSAGSGASSYWLEVGTTLGGKNIYPGAQTTARSATVSGLPTNGSTVYVRLWTFVGGGWQYTDYQYKAV